MYIYSIGSKSIIVNNFEIKLPEPLKHAVEFKDILIVNYYLDNRDVNINKQIFFHLPYSPFNYLVDSSDLSTSPMMSRPSSG